MPDPWVIRLAEMQDLPDVSAIVQAAYAPYVARLGQPPGPMLDDYEARIRARQVHVLSEDGQTRGLVVLIDEPDAVLLDNLAVAPAWQGRGYGRALMEHTERRARAIGAARVRLYTNEAMTENIAIYARAGFVETHRAEQHGFRRAFMEKDLDTFRHRNV